MLRSSDVYFNRSFAFSPWQFLFYTFGQDGTGTEMSAF
uniref:Uncharacterized protein n=1 Tax=Anguilla anguilla TaxID=7936 RepID=A0A0E9U8M7_ANGAN